MNGSIFLLGFLYVLGLIPASIDVLMRRMKMRKSNLAFVALNAVSFSVVGAGIAHINHSDVIQSLKCVMGFAGVSFLASMPRLSRRRINRMERDLARNGASKLSAEQVRKRLKFAAPGLLYPNGWVMLLLLILDRGYFSTIQPPGYHFRPDDEPVYSTDLGDMAFNLMNPFHGTSMDAISRNRADDESRINHGCP